MIIYHISLLCILILVSSIIIKRYELPTEYDFPHLLMPVDSGGSVYLGKILMECSDSAFDKRKMTMLIWFVTFLQFLVKFRESLNCLSCNWGAGA